jgi:hypothetical protein
MPLFDFFKKPDKKEPPKSAPAGLPAGQEKQPNAAQQSATDNPFSSPEQNKKRYEAAMDFLQFFQEKTPLLNGRPHAGTVLSIAARLAGTSLFRSINKKDFEPGVVVLSEEVNLAYPQLLNLFAYFCKQNGIDVMTKPLITEIPEPDKPRMELAQLQAEYQQEYNLIMKKHGLDYLESARAGMIMCSILFSYHCINNKDIDPYVATGIVAMGVVEGAKTSPMPLETKTQSTAAGSDSKGNKATELIKTIAGTSSSGSGERLVLGEKFTAMKEAMDNGGKYILVHPEVENKLQQAGIDPYLIYSTVLTQQIEAKISQIDFIDVDVEGLFQEWSNKPKDQAPMYVRQMLWLKENAEKYGYQQSGNSWKLK